MDRALNYLALARKVDALCRKYDATITQVLLGFFLSAEIPMVPLASANNVTQLTEIATAPEIPFDPKDFLFRPLHSSAEGVPT